MQVIEVQLKENSGSCYYCQKFQDDFKYFINIQYKFCSVRCLLHYYDNGDLKIIWDVIIPSKPKPARRTYLINILAFAMEKRGW